MDKLHKVFCALFGHSHIYNVFMGYHNCARCGALCGDSLGGTFKDSLCVSVGHNCQTCFDNYAKLKWWDKLFVPYPFEKDDSGQYRVITKEERDQKMQAALDSMREHRKIRDQRMAELKTLSDDLPEKVLGWVKDQPVATIDKLIHDAIDQEKNVVAYFEEQFQLAS